MTRRKQQSQSTVGASVLIAGILLLDIFLAFALGNSLLEDMKNEKYLKDFALGNDRLSAENDEKAGFFRYVQSPQYNNKYKKEYNGEAGIGEKVIIVEFGPTGLEGTEESDAALLKKQILLSRPNREQWRIYFFGEDN